MSLSHAIALADSIRRKIDSASHDPTHRAVTADEIAAGRLGRQKAKGVLSASIAVVNEALAVVRGNTPPSSPCSNSKARKARTSSHASNMKHSSMSSINSALDEVLKDMSGQGLKDGSVDSLEKMANAIEPVIDKFDEVLAAPNLNAISATLNTVPVVGLKGDAIMYVNTTSSTSGEGALDYSWAYFSSLPHDAKIASGEEVHFFPFNGDFYLSIGKSVWSKAHISDTDPTIKQAVDNWPALYVKEWTSIGANILPAADLASLIPFAVLDSSRGELAFKLVMLASNGSFSYFNTNTLTPNSEIRTLSYKPSSDGPSTSPKFVQAAYCNNKIVAVDDLSNLWDLAVNWDSDMYTISNSTRIDPSVEFTANDVGPVSLRADGYLWQRFVEAPPAGSKDDPKLEWKRWLKGDGITDLGVASPGIVFDMNTLTNALRGRYVDVQTAVYPVVNVIAAFGKTHIVFLNLASDKADEWQNASDAEQQKMAEQAADLFLAHAQAWSTKVSTSISNVRDSVNVMTDQLRDIHEQLDTQLNILQDTLKQLNAQLDQQKEQLSELQIEFWASVMGSILGLLLILATVISMSPLQVLIGGFLFAAGIIGRVLVEIRTAELAGEIEQTNQQMRDVTSAIRVISTITPLFADLDSLYGILNQFWGRMANNAGQIGDMDDAARMAIATDMYDPTNIIAGQQYTQELVDACTTYLDVLNRQGIIIPPKSMKMLSADAATAEKSDDLVDAARAALAKGDFDGYLALMSRASLVESRLSAEASRASLATGLWFDVPALSSTAGIWMHDSTFTHSVDFPASVRSDTDTTARAVVALADDMDDSLDEVRPYVSQMLQGVISLGDTMIGWTAQYPTMPTDPDGIAAVEKLQQEALDACDNAQDMAQTANNGFAGFTNDAREYQQDLERKIHALKDQQAQASAKAQAKIDNLGSPPPLGMQPASAMYQLQVIRIEQELMNEILPLEADIITYTLMKQSGVIFQGKALTWVDMAQNVSGDLGDVYNVLTGVDGQLLENPILYADFMRTEWEQIVQDARDVFTMLNCGVRSSATRSSATLTLHNISITETLSPPSALRSIVEARAAAAQALSLKLDELLRVKHLEGTVGYWSEGNTQRTALLSIVYRARSDYRKAEAAQRRAIRRIHALAVLLESLAENATDGRISPTLLFQHISDGLSEAVADGHRENALATSATTQLEFTLDTTSKFSADVAKRIEAIDSLPEGRRASAVATVVASSFAGSGILVKAGIPGPVIATLTSSVKASATLPTTTSAIKLLLESSEPNILSQTVAALQGLKQHLKSGVADLETLRPLVGPYVQANSELATLLADAHAAADVTLRVVSALGKVTLTVEDVDAIRNSWAALAEVARSQLV